MGALAVLLLPILPADKGVCSAGCLGALLCVKLGAGHLMWPSPPDMRYNVSRWARLAVPLLS